MVIFAALRMVLTLAISSAVLICTLIALIDAVRHSDHVFIREGKKTKKFWLLILGAGVLFALIGFAGMIGIVLTIAAIAPAAVYWYDVRPAIKYDSRTDGNAQNRSPERTEKFWANYRGY